MVHIPWSLITSAIFEGLNDQGLKWPNIEVTIFMSVIYMDRFDCQSLQYLLFVVWHYASAAFAIVGMSVCPFVLSITLVDCVKTAQPIVMKSMTECTLVSLVLTCKIWTG